MQHDNRPTIKQLEFIRELCFKQNIAPHTLGRIKTFLEAKRTIDDLLAKMPLQPSTRQAIFAALRHTSYTKDDMYSALGITSLRECGGATEGDGQRCLKWLRGERVDVTWGVGGWDELEDVAKAVKASGTPAPADAEWIPWLDDPVLSGASSSVDVRANRGEKYADSMQAKELAMNSKSNKPRRFGRMRGAEVRDPAAEAAAEADRRLDAFLSTTEGQRRDWSRDHINPMPFLWGHWQKRFENQSEYQEFRLALERRGLASAQEPVQWGAAA